MPRKPSGIVRKQFSVMLEVEWLNELERRANKNGRSVGEEIRRILSVELDKS